MTAVDEPFPSSSDIGSGTFFSPSLGESQPLNGGEQVTMQQSFPFKHCETCGRRTSWIILFGTLAHGNWHRVCPACMSLKEKMQYHNLMANTGKFRQRIIVKYGQRGLGR